jgi:hypothetical protein
MPAGSYCLLSASSWLNLGYSGATGHLGCVKVRSKFLPCEQHATGGQLMQWAVCLVALGYSGATGHLGCVKVRSKFLPCG